MKYDDSLFSDQPAPAATATPAKMDDSLFSDEPAPKGGKSVGGFIGNAVSDAGNIIGGTASLAANAVTHPIDTAKQAVHGIPAAVKELAKTWGVPEAMEGRFSDMISKIGNSVYEKPVSRALDVASVAMPALKGAGLIKGVEGADLASQAGKLGDLADDTSAIYRTKNMGARTKAFDELTEDEAIRLGHRAKELDMTGGAKSSLKKGQDLMAQTGEDIGTYRKAGDHLNSAPTMDEINAAIEQQLGDKYRVGRHAGEGTEFNRAKDDVNKLKSKESPTLSKPVVKQNTPEEGQMDLLDQPEQLFPDSQSYSKKFDGAEEVPNPKFAESQPGASALAEKATDMNAWADKEKSYLRPAGATADVANLVSHANDTNLVHALGAEQGKGYLDALSTNSDLHTMNKMLHGKRSRELGTSTAPGSIPAKILHYGQDRFGYRLTAATLDKVATFLKTNPEKFGKYATVLNGAMTAGPAALATTVDLLGQRDPEFAKQLETLK